MQEENRKCKDCKWWVEDENQKSRLVTYNNGDTQFSKEEYRMGFCHRYPRVSAQELEFEFWWCGEFETKK